MRYAREGRLSKPALASLLTPASQQAFFTACAAIEAAYTEACACADDPCLESGCSCEGEVCLQPLLRAGDEYQRACGAEFAERFASERNRDAGWKLTASRSDATTTSSS